MNINIFEKSKPVANEETSFASEQAEQIKQKIESRKGKQKKIKMILGALVVLVLILSAVTAYSQYKLHTLAKEEQKVGNTPTQIPKTGDEVIAALGRHILLPSGTPQIAAIEDVSKLQQTQAFFKDAENGDIVVVYESTIFIYRPSKDIVVASGDISGAGQTKP